MMVSISRNGIQYSPISLEQLNREVVKGNVLRTDLAWYGELPRWIPVGQVPGIKRSKLIPREKSVFLAGVLNWIFPGIGYVYCGRDSGWFVFLLILLCICAGAGILAGIVAPFMGIAGALYARKVNNMIRLQEALVGPSPSHIQPQQAVNDSIMREALTSESLPTSSGDVLKVKERKVQKSSSVLEDFRSLLEKTRADRRDACPTLPAILSKTDFSNTLSEVRPDQVGEQPAETIAQTDSVGCLRGSTVPTFQKWLTFMKGIMKVQKKLILIWVAIGGFLLIGLFPPWSVYPEPNMSGKTETVYGLLFQKPDMGDEYNAEFLYRAKIDTTRLLIQWILWGVLCGGIGLTIKSYKNV